VVSALRVAIVAALQKARLFSKSRRRVGHSYRIQELRELISGTKMIKPHARRLIIAEWLSLPKEERETKQQACVFAVKAAARYQFECVGDPQKEIMEWLSSHIGKP
jgi:hypothetical protein